ncbi:acyl-CoA-binding protein [Dactylosporangium sp. CA-139066]|uniref:acyl-CoA-binding protein n=1 Tax=Dactylosporangium sp. CA-139066 TaxID=3239930 RepID=UPI003D9212B8
MSVTEEFERAQVEVKELAKRPGNEVLLQLYALYKQGTQGDANGKRPGVFDLVGRAKYDAWSGLAGTPQQDAQRRYVELVRQLQAGD